MSPLAYYSLWLAAGLVLAAAASAAFTRLMRRREQALALADALSRHGVWVAAQRSPLARELRREEAGAALQEACELQARWFPRLASELGTVIEIDRRLQQFLTHQHQLRLSDPEAWLESDHDEHFMRLWRQYVAAVALLTENLQRITRDAALRASQQGPA